MSAGEPAPAPAAAAAQGLRARIARALSDRLNPILVREVHQALNGKGFLVTSAMAFAATVVIAMLVAAQTEVSPRDGAQAFLNTFRALIPILMFIVPFQAFLSMRAEVGGGTVEHLLMSRLSPGAIVRGKFAAAAVQFGIYLAIFAPLLALTFLLRGVDVPTIAVLLVMAFVFAVACSALAIACGALCRWRAFFQVVPFAAVLLGLGWFTFGAMLELDSFVRMIQDAFAEEEFFFWMGSSLMPAALVTVLFALIGAAALAHPYENRATPFRLYAFGFVLVSFAWTLYNYDRAGGAAAVTFFDLGDQLVMVSISAAFMLSLFPLFAATEAPSMSPRVRDRVPRSPLLALLVAPLLPGAGRGMLFGILLAGLTLGGVYVLPEVWGGAPADGDAWRGLIVAWLYLTLFAHLAGRIRTLMGPGERFNWWARGSMPTLLLLGVLLPLLASITAGRSMLMRWTPLQLLNPFYTVAAMGGPDRDAEILTWLSALTAVAVASNVPAMARGFHEVLQASRERRIRAR